MLVIKDRRHIAILKSLGFTSGDLRHIYMLGSLFLVSICIVLGIILAGTLGQSLAGLFIRGGWHSQFQIRDRQGFCFFDYADSFDGHRFYWNPYQRSFNCTYEIIRPYSGVRK